MFIFTYKWTNSLIRFSLIQDSKRSVRSYFDLKDGIPVLIISHFYCQYYCVQIFSVINFYQKNLKAVLSEMWKCEDAIGLEITNNYPDKNVPAQPALREKK